MKVLITGAAGFLGQYVVAEALCRGHAVRAVVRPSTDLSQVRWRDRPDVEGVRLNLNDREGLYPAVRGVDAAIHLAAAKSGDFASQFTDTVAATQKLLAVMGELGLTRLVAISSFSVYDRLHPPEGTLLDESSSLEPAPQYRDAYAQMKLLQERLVRAFEQNRNGAVTLLRPGAIYGRENLWNAHLGAKLQEDLWLAVGDRARIPLTYVENCASAIVKALESPEAIGQTLNIVDDDLPTQREFVELLAAQGVEMPRTIPIGWTAMRLLARAVWTLSQSANHPFALPGILTPARLHARFKPLNYSNSRAKQLLRWRPSYFLATAIARSRGKFPLPELPTPSMVQPRSSQTSPRTPAKTPTL
ncbi:NAD(P)-dependent oxidoreductase [Synechococcus sp. PCC 7336]|uniref:NAD-dependent epimerase/dehydratase family protein n=1 Tax=Synechococcus sp. PCC 7336 TaxID=195250 RepID=UPI00034B2CBB|nr:NAD-dependent epimerase/dehydratase family protein [Synechococcus sp. PCC 7336]